MFKDNVSNITAPHIVDALTYKFTVLCYAFLSSWIPLILLLSPESQLLKDIQKPDTVVWICNSNTLGVHSRAEAWETQHYKQVLGGLEGWLSN